MTAAIDTTTSTTTMVSTQERILSPRFYGIQGLGGSEQQRNTERCHEKRHQCGTARCGCSEPCSQCSQDAETDRRKGDHRQQPGPPTQLEVVEGQRHEQHQDLEDQQHHGARRGAAEETRNRVDAQSRREVAMHRQIGAHTSRGDHHAEEEHYHPHQPRPHAAKRRGVGSDGERHEQQGDGAERNHYPGHLSPPALPQQFQGGHGHELTPEAHRTTPPSRTTSSVDERLETRTIVGHEHGAAVAGSHVVEQKLDQGRRCPRRGHCAARRVGAAWVGA